MICDAKTFTERIKAGDQIGVMEELASMKQNMIDFTKDNHEEHR